MLSRIIRRHTWQDHVGPAPPGQPTDSSAEIPRGTWYNGNCSGSVLIEALAAVAITSVMVAVIVVGVSHIARQRSLLWQRLIAQQALCNTLEVIDGWLIDETTNQRLQSLPLETWASEQLPGARLECRLLDQTDDPLRGVQVAVVWQGTQRGNASETEIRWTNGREFREEATLWKPSEPSI